VQRHDCALGSGRLLSAIPSEVSYGWGEVGDLPLQGEDFELEYFEDGYPKLPDCLKTVGI
jgi:hypothetical protein